ncbi:MFS transporter [Halomicroarcula sp. S1AR25-4]|uniref:MFS transporter n=1 Tax=Haloarcula sp. S1AR25-4 TaxID=2950538 RepID=UPI002876F0C8|nr:MFS transporter [Halomicroarcula sp. S1AR25-4]MDS0278860.1 MFS transporter [Halomicroarcula sp. S1AR25-4]
MAVTDAVRRTVRDLREGHPGRLLGAVAAGWFLVLGMRFVVPAVLPTITEEFGLSNAAAGLAVTVLWLTYAAMQFPTGALIDRVGERTLLVAAALLSGAGLLAYFVSATYALFLLATAAFGLGTGLYGPTRGTVLSRTFDANEGTAFGAVMAAGSIGAAALPFVASVATARYGWRIALGGVAPVFVVVALALWLSVSDRPTATDGRRLREDLRAALAGIRNRGLLLAVVGATVMLFVFQAATAFLTTYLVTVKTLDQSTAGGVLSVLFVGGAISQSVTGRLADRYGSPPVLTAVALVSAVPLALLPRLHGELALAAGAAAIGIRMSAGPLSNAYIVDVLPDDVQGTGWGLLRSAFFAVGSLGSTLVGLLADGGLFDVAFYLMAGLTALAALAYLALPHRA